MRVAGGGAGNLSYQTMIPLRDDNPSQTAPVVTIALLAAVALVFLWQLYNPLRAFAR